MVQFDHSPPERSKTQAASNTQIYSSEQFIKDLCAYSRHPGETVDASSARFSVDRLSARVWVSCTPTDPRADGSLHDVMNISVLEGRMEKSALSYIVTREELPGAVPVIAAFLRARAFADHLADGIDRDEVLELARGGLIGSNLANVIDNLPAEGSRDDLVRMAMRPEPDELSGITVPLSAQHRQILDMDSPRFSLYKMTGLADRIALAAVLRADEASDDFALAVDVLCRSMGNYYLSPQAKQNRIDFDRYRTREALRKQELLRESHGDYRLENRVKIPKLSAPATFELPIPEALDSSVLAGSTLETHYYSAFRTIADPDTGERKTLPWLNKHDNEYLTGPKVDEIIGEALRRGYLVIQKSNFEEPLAKELLNLWDLIQRDIWNPGRRPAPIEALVCVSAETPEHGRVFTVHFSDAAAERRNEHRPAELEALRGELDLAFKELPEDVKGTVARNYPGGQRLVDNGQAGSICVCEKYPRMLEILFAYLRHRAAMEWAQSSAGSK